MKYKVTCFHHRKAIIKGDLESETITDSIEVFSSKKEVVRYLNIKADVANYKRYKYTLNTKIKNSLPSLIVYTGIEWTHENSGELESEYYFYKTETVR